MSKMDASGSQKLWHFIELTDLHSVSNHCYQDILLAETNCGSAVLLIYYYFLIITKDHYICIYLFIPRVLSYGSKLKSM